MTRFKIGDIITGTSNSHYRITNSDVICEVIRNSEMGDMVVRVLRVRDDIPESRQQAAEERGQMGVEYPVDESLFVLYGKYGYNQATNKFGYFPEGAGVIYV